MKLFQWLRKKPKEKRMYVIVRSDLEATYRIVQGSHALAQYSIEHPKLFSEWGNQTIIYLATRFHSGIDRWCDNLADVGKAHSFFKEPDQEYQLTAIACYDTGEIFKSLPLARV